jgi:glucitol/sorbitol PTS system EIIA component
MTYYRTTVLRLGPEAAEMVSAGVVIFFAEPVPPALEEVSVIHQPSQPLSAPIRVGDVVLMGTGRLTITGVGEIAADNLEKLGHIVLYANQSDEKQILPGAVLGTGTLPVLAPGDVIEFQAGDTGDP